MDRAERIVFWAITASALCYLLMRAAYVPITHDESRTFFIYVVTGEFFPWFSFWDAANHFISTGVGWLSYRLGGMSPLSLRVGSLIAFLLYARYTWLWGCRMQHRGIRYLLWLSLIAIPGYIEFFALFRGYAMGMAFMLMALYHQALFNVRARRKDLVLALVAWPLAGWSMLSLSLIWSVAILLLLPALLLDQKPGRDCGRAIVLWMLLGVVPLMLGLLYGSELRDRGLLYDGTDAGLVEGTYRLLLNTLFGATHGPYFTWSMGLMIGAVAVAGWYFIGDPRQRWRDGLILVVGLLLAEFCGRELLWRMADVRYPMGRTALHWVPLIILAIAFAVDWIAQLNRKWVLLGIPLVMLPVRTFATLNLSYAWVWPEEALPERLMQAVCEAQRAADRPLLIDAYGLMSPQWDYTRQWKMYQVPPVSHYGFPQPLCDFVLIDTLGYRPPPGFRKVELPVWSRQTLFMREMPLRLIQIRDTLSHALRTKDEFIGIPTPAGLPMGNMAVELSMVILSPDRCFMAGVVFDIALCEDSSSFYERLDLRQLQRHYVGDTLHFTRRIPLSTSCNKLDLYIWNPLHQEVEVPYMKIRMLQIVTDDDISGPETD